MSMDEWLVQHARVSSRRHRRITLDDKLAFFQQLATLIASGTPLLQSLHIAAEQSQSTRMQEVLEHVASRVAAGETLRNALLEYRSYFEDHWIELVGVGEASGNMGKVLVDLNDQIRESCETRRKVVGSLVYPAILLIVAVGVVVAMLWFVVPKFAGMFEEMGAELPGITRFVLDASDFIVNYGIFLVFGVIGGAIGFRCWMRTEAGMRYVGSVILALPLLGDMAVQSAMYRFSATLALLLRSGVPLMETLTVLVSVFRTSPVYRDAFLHAQRRVAAGHGLADSLQDTNLFTSMMTNVVRLGEESAQLPEVLDQIAPYYKEKLNGFISRITKLMEPCIIVFMGGTIALIMLAIYIPMFDMAGAVN